MPLGLDQTLEKSLSMAGVIKMDLEYLQNGIERAVSNLRDSVVRINSTGLRRSYGYGIQPVQGSGSGIVIKSEGYIVTNNHVVEGTESVEVILPDGTSVPGEVIGGDPNTDIAVLKVKREGLKGATLGDSDQVKPGHLALAMGNSFGLPGEPTVSMGLISAVGRPMPWADFIFEGLIQTDAAINPGNSGGPLSDISGNVIGINTAIIPFAQGMGFAIPINTVKRVMGEILREGRVIRPQLGISGISLTPEISNRYGIKAKSGVFIVRVNEGSQAEKSGLREGDVITEFGGSRIENMKKLLEELTRGKLGERKDLTIVRRGLEYQTSVRLIEGGDNPRLRVIG